jgi:hypothetical protein
VLDGQQDDGSPMRPRRRGRRSPAKDFESVDRDHAVLLGAFGLVVAIDARRRHTHDAASSIDDGAAAVPRDDRGVEKQPPESAKRPKADDLSRCESTRVADVVVRVAEKRDVIGLSQSVG